jgi:hypothetical protein
MWSLHQPTASEAAALDDSRSRLSLTHPRTTRVNAARDTVLAEMLRYRERGLSSELHLFPSNVLAIGSARKEDLIFLYESGLMRLGAGRHIYDAILGLAPNSRCPYCGHRRVRQLDHFLPKSKYPAFSVTPLNLVPSCSDCNKDKLDGDCDDLTDLPLHPYFDSIDDVCWLQAAVEEVSGSVFLFSVDEGCGLPPSILERLLKQFNKLDLGGLYTIISNEELSSIRLTLRAQLQAGGALGVKVYLEDQFLSSQGYLRNYWRTAFYCAAYRSDWFCQGGFDDASLP